MRNIAVGSFVSDGNAKTVLCGFVPEAVILCGGAGTPSMGIYFCKLAQSKVAGDLSKTELTGSAVDGFTVAADVAVAASGVAGHSDTDGQGFTIAATANCPENANTDTVRYIALRGDTLNVPELA